MTNSDFSNPTQFKVDTFEIDGVDVVGLFMTLSIYENIFSPVITGNITIFDTDGSGFVEDNEIEFLEEFKFSFKNAKDETIEFEGVLNGLTNKMIKDSKKIYNVDFTSKSVRQNESKFIWNYYYHICQRSRNILKIENYVWKMILYVKDVMVNFQIKRH